MRIRSVSVVDVARRTTVGDQVVEWDGDRITAVGPDDGTPPAAGDVDGRGLFALPGLIDCHVHVTSLSTDEWADSGHPAATWPGTPPGCWRRWSAAGSPRSGTPAAPMPA